MSYYDEDDTERLWDAIKSRSAEFILEALSGNPDLNIIYDGKTALQELAATLNLSAPEYEITESGPDHDKSFVAAAILSSEKFPAGHGKSKREAEQAAAKIAHELLSIRSNKK